MRAFRVLIVEDDLTIAETTTLNVRALDLTAFDGEEFSGFAIDVARNQEEIDKLVTNAEPVGYDLVLLDLKYRNRATDEFSAAEKIYQGMKWLPEARRLLPSAAIVVYTAYPYEEELKNTVKAILEHNAEDFIPKTAEWSHVEPRLRIAWQRARERERTRRLNKEMHELLQSMVLRTVAEDLNAIVDDCAAPFETIARSIETGDPSAIGAAPDKLRAAYRSLRELARQQIDILKRRNGQTSHISDITVWVRQLCELYSDHFREVGAKLIVSGDPGLEINTGESELRIALHEVLYNSELALAEATMPPGRREVQIRVGGYHSSNVEITVEDNGSGFPDGALPDRVFSPGYSNRSPRTAQRHPGMGLYVARRMMAAIGGSIKAGPANTTTRSDSGARVCLVLPDLG